ncbi:striated muscle preferentially expressed protein kinase-like isoform X2 [Thalassophryne amazonica]|uniref:striated muscle preferentially expressed protein kinase-like isoform X2 n=1 Tax=Thalassophryne amazonica TaxID=390379 RepID=UPI00147200EC|nr:striated muscle preferentially expressed protein kinase-like isoform X2 [Thalassophryne amazonica]
MKKIWSKKRFQRTGHSTWTFGRFTHVFRSCRKQSYDSETTEDETTEPQVSMETKEGAGKHQDKAGRRGPAGEGGRVMDLNPDGSDRRATLPGGYDPVVERELRTLGSRPPGPHLDTTSTSRTQTLDESQGLPSRDLLSSPTSNQVSPNQHKNGTTALSQEPPKMNPTDVQPQNLKTDQVSGKGVNDLVMLPKMARAGPKIFDKVRAFEERRASVDLPGGTSGRSHVGFGRTTTYDSDIKTGGLSKNEGRILQDAAHKRAAFKQQAYSLEDDPGYFPRVRSYQSKFSEELQRLKKLMGNPSLKKSYSTEHLALKELVTVGKLEPIPPQVVRKLEARERALEESKHRGNLRNQCKIREKNTMTQPDSQGKPVDGSSLQNTGKISVTKEAAPVHRLPGKPLPTSTRTNFSRETLQRELTEKPSLTAAVASKTSFPSKHLSQCETDSKRLTMMEKKSDRRSPSPTERKTSSVTVKEDSGSQYPPKPPRLTPSPAMKVTIPTILVDDESMETEGVAGDECRQKPTTNKEGTRHKSKKGQFVHSKSLEEGASSDDTYMSADEDPTEGPQFGKSLEDVTAPSGSEVTLTCVIAGSPPPTVTWKKNGVEVHSDAFHVVKAEGERHDLLIKQMTASDAGTYCVTAANAAGWASCSAALCIQSGPTHVQCGKPAASPQVSSPIQSDEEYLSPQEEAMELEEPPNLTKPVHFKEPPTFQVVPCDQSVNEGQDVVMSVKVGGQPKPMVYWLRNGVTVRTAGRITVQQTDGGVGEMRISSAQRSHAGLYVCKIINESGTKEAECRLEVTSAARTTLKITRDVADKAVRAGESAMFECHVAGPPDVDVDWLADGKLIQPALLNCKMHFDGKRCRLLLNSVHEDDSGTYTCKLSTAKVELTSNANLKVMSSREPLFTRKLDILEVIEGRTARFDCKVSGSPAPTVTWMHFDKPVEESDNVRILREGGRHSLVIAHVSSNTEGFYTAIARNMHGRAECTAELYVQEARAAISSHMTKLEKMPSIPEEPEVLESEVERRTMPDFVKPLADVEVTEGKEVVLKCKVAGLPYPTIAWYHNGKRIESSEERRMTQYRDVHSLVIRSACHSHRGVYKSVISNKVGKAACYAHLYVTDIVPDPPDGPPVIETITGKTIHLSWKRPKRLDPSLDAASLLYVVQQQHLGSIQWSVVASHLKETNYTVTSLSKGVRYAFRVLTSTGKTLSKPSPSTDLVQLLDRGPYLRKAPVFLEKPDTVYVVENQLANITVTLNHVHATITWKRREEALVSKPGMYEMSMPDDDQHTLTIQRVRSTDIGQLVVVASNKFGSDLCMLQLAMAVPPKFESIMEDLDVDVGETSCLAVVVEGKPDPDILWYKDDVLLSESNYFTFVYDGPEYSLVVLNAAPEHSGVYTCMVKNLAGSISCKAELTVHTERKDVPLPAEDEGSILRKMRRLTDYYDIHKEIGRGAFSYVKRVTQKESKAEFAAKFISARGKRKALALREMDLLSELDNERILYFHDAFEKKNVVVLITELCHEELLERMAKKTTVMESEVRCSIQQLLEGLRYLHQKQIIHLDIKPENILMLNPISDRIRICDFGNTIKFETSEVYYCKYGTPEYVAPEIINQTPVSTATDIWPVGVITYLCLTGVSPFAGENDRATALNIRNYNVAFEESMFSDLCREAKGFVIKLLVVDKLRPSAVECLRHPWFKSTTNKGINTTMLKQVLSQRRWQRSLISYKSKMVMRTIPELLSDSASHTSIAMARHLKEGSPPPSSSSDSEADVDELPFIPMPLSLVFSGSRVSLNEIPGDEDISGWPSVTTCGTGKKADVEVAGKTATTAERLTDEKEPPNEGKLEMTKQSLLKKGMSMESEELQMKARRATMRRGSSADSALVLHIDSEEGNANEDSEANKKTLKKAVSMELPNRSSSPTTAKISQEDYALKLELMRQRLLRGGSVDKKMSGLRGPLFETLGVDDQRRTGSLDRTLRRSRAGPPTLTRAATAEGPGEDTPKVKVFQKSASFTQGDSEPMPLHRRFGAPLEIPSVGSDSIEDKRLQEATSMSALAEQITLESKTASTKENSSFVLPTPGNVDQQQPRSPSVLTPTIVIEENKEEDSTCTTPENSTSSSAYISDTQTVAGPCRKSDKAPVDPTDPGTITKVPNAHPFAGSATISSTTDPRANPLQPVLRKDIKDIDSEEVFEARFKKRESSLTRGLRRLARHKADEKSPVLSQKVGLGSEEVYRPAPRGAPLEMLSTGLQEKSKSVQDLRSIERETGFGLIGRFSMRSKRSASVEKSVEKPKEEKHQDVLETFVKKRVSWAIGRSKSLDTNEPNSATAPRELERERKTEESSVSAMRRRFESKVAGISAKLRTQSEDRKEAESSQKETAQKDGKKVTDSPVLAMRQMFDNKVGKISTKFRSQSEERRGDTEEKQTPLFTRHRHSQSEGRGLKGMGIPENQLAKQTGGGTSKESIESSSSFQCEKGSTESVRRSRWDRWGLTRSKKEKNASKSNLPKDDLSKYQQFIRSASDFAPVFHIKLKDQILLEGELVTLSCLPAASPQPEITWTKDWKPLEVDDRITLVSHPDGRQLLTIAKSSRRDAGIYECVATNLIASITTSCSLSIASVPKRPGTPEIPQTYSNTALVLWKPTETKAPCSYTLEKKTEGHSKWFIVATGIADCYYNVTDLPLGGTFRFRVACVNKAGQGPYSNISAPVSLDPTGGGASSGMVVVKTVPAAPEAAVTTSVTAPPLRPAHRVTASALTLDAAPPATFPPPTSSSLSPPPSSPATNPPSASPGATPEEAPKPNLPPSATVKAPPPFVLPKPQSPVNVVSPMTQSPPISPPPPLITSPLTPTKPLVSSVPTYVPTITATACVMPTSVTFSPPVVQASSLSPIGEGLSTLTRGTPSERTAPSTALRQGVPQKPYTFLEEKARGRFGVVRECRENATGKLFMAKIITYDQQNKPEVLKEYEILKSLHSEKVMALHEAYITPRYLVLVLEYCTGKELLYSLIDRFRYSEDDVVGYLVQIIQGVEYLHNHRVLHLDLKPDNIIVTNLNAVKIVDFGSAQSFNPLSLKHQGAAEGTLEYMAPEVLKGDVVGPPADIWTIGVVTHIMLSGRLPFEDKNPAQVESKILMARFDPAKLYPNVSQSASTFLKKMLSSYPWARPSTRDCFMHAWLQDSYLMKLRRQTLTFTTSRLKEFLVEQQYRRTEGATKHKVLLRTYQGSPKSVVSPAHVPSPK